MQLQRSNMTIAEQIKLENAEAQQETIEKQGVLIEFLAGMCDVEIPDLEERGENNVQDTFEG